ncbi:MAG: NUDIX domain-containing protein [Gemmatimonadota bacterium]|nr:NUDIX domain-containing protein [Gemmatimonadota bacterium]
MTVSKARGRKSSTGLLLFRRLSGATEVLLAHPGSPYAAHQDVGVWTIPKGSPHPTEDLLTAARREFLQETGIVAVGPFLPLGPIQQSKKIVIAWAWEGDADAEATVSEKMRTHLRRGSRRLVEHFEVDRCQWFSIPEARERIVPAQRTFLDRLEMHLLSAGISDQ